MQSPRSDECWLCVYAGEEVAQSVTGMIVDNVHAMDVREIAKQVTQVIEKEAREKYGESVDLRGHTADDVRRHITKHMLHAPVALACTLRSLNELSDQLRQQVYTVDEETGHSVLDAAQVKNYLALVNQITSIYKVGDSSRLLFARPATDKKDA